MSTSAYLSVGRGPELDAWGRTLDEGVAGRGSVVVIDGEPGVGKTHLAREVTRLAASRRFTVLTGTGHEWQRQRPFGALATALDLRPGGDDPARTRLGRLLAGSDARSGQISDDIADLVETLALRGPVLLCIDDLQWVDPATMMVLRALAARASELPLVLLLLTRSAGVAIDFDAASHKTLGPLGSTDVEALATGLLGAHPDGELERYLTGTGGNPLYVQELIRGLLEEGALHHTDDQVSITSRSLPPSFRLAILRRVATLASEGGEVLKVASVLGSPFAVRDLAVVSGRTPVALLRVLAEPLQSGLLDEDDDQLRFRHDLVRDVLYGEIPVAIRKAMHRQVAESLEGLGLDRTRVLDHVIAGASLGDADAVVWLRATADEIATQSIPGAIRILREALTLEPPTELRHEATADLVEVLARGGQPDEADRLATDMLAGPLAPHIEARVRLAVANLTLLRRSANDVLAELRVVASLDGANLPERALATASCAYFECWIGDPVAAAATADTAVSLVDAGGDPVATARLHEARTLIALANGRVPEALDAADNAVKVMNRAHGMRAAHNFPQLWRAMALYEADRIDEALAATQLGRRQAEATGNRSWAVLFTIMAAQVLTEIGRLDDGLDEAQAALAAGDELGIGPMLLFPHVVQAQIHLHHNDLVASHHALDRARSAFSLTGPQFGVDLMFRVEALLLEANGDPAAATTMLTTTWDLMAPMRYFVGYRMIGLDLVRLAIDADPRCIATVVEEIEEGASRNPAGTVRAFANLGRGVLDRAPDVILQAVRGYRDGPRPLQAGNALEIAATALRQLGRSDDTVACLDDAATLWGQAGATRDQSRCHEKLRELGVIRRRSSTPTTVRFGWDALTNAEHEVTRLLIEGGTNRQIGERLFVSRRTVETHLSHIYTKLGLTNRAQLVAAASARSRNQDQ